MDAGDAGRVSDIIDESFSINLSITVAVVVVVDVVVVDPVEVVGVVEVAVAKKQPISGIEKL